MIQSGKMVVSLALSHVVNFVMVLTGHMIPRRKSLLFILHFSLRASLFRLLGTLGQRYDTEHSNKQEAAVSQVPAFLRSSLATSSASAVWSGIQNAWVPVRGAHGGINNLTYQFGTGSGHHCQAWVEPYAARGSWMAIHLREGLDARR